MRCPLLPWRVEFLGWAGLALDFSAARFFPMKSQSFAFITGIFEVVQGFMREVWQQWVAVFPLIPGWKITPAETHHNTLHKGRGHGDCKKYLSVLKALNKGVSIGFASLLRMCAHAHFLGSRTQPPTIATNSTAGTASANLRTLLCLRV